MWLLPEAMGYYHAHRGDPIRSALGLDATGAEGLSGNGAGTYKTNTTQAKQRTAAEKRPQGETKLAPMWLSAGGNGVLLRTQ